MVRFMSAHAPFVDFEDVSFAFHGTIIPQKIPLVIKPVV